MLCYVCLKRVRWGVLCYGESLDVVAIQDQGFLGRNRLRDGERGSQSHHGHCCRARDGAADKIVPSRFGLFRNRFWASCNFSTKFQALPFKTICITNISISKYLLCNLSYCTAY